jgi:hypothetical protein
MGSYLSSSGALGKLPFFDERMDKRARNRYKNFYGHKKSNSPV